MSSVKKLKAKIQTTENHYSAIKVCPICGAYPHLMENNLDRGNGHGYPGCFLYWYECPSCGLIKSEAVGSDIHDKNRTKEKALQKAADGWNELVDYINILIDKTRGQFHE